MKKLPQLLFLFMLITVTQILAQAPNWLWSNRAGGTQSDNGYSNGIDALGNIYVIGTFNSDSISFGGTKLINQGVQDIFFVKYDASGNIIWAKSAGGTALDASYSIVVETNGNFYLSGLFNSPSISFGNITLTNSGNDNHFIAKYNSSGNFLWVNQITGGSLSVGGLDSSEHLYLMGGFTGATFTLGTTTLNNASSGTSDIILAKFDTAGSVIWLKREGSNGNDGISNMSVNASGKFCITGGFASSTISFGSTATLTNAGLNDIYIASYDSSGNALWSDKAGGVQNETGLSIMIDNNNNVYTTGYFFSPAITFGSTTLTNANPVCCWGDVFIVKYNSTGSVLWTQRAGGIDNDRGFSLTTDGTGNVYLTGTFDNSTITFGNTILTNADNTGNSSDIFIVKYDGTGTVLWAQRAGGTDPDWAWEITLNVGGNLYLSGSFWSSTIAFGSTTLTNAGGIDFFVAKMDNVTGITENNTSINAINIFPNPFSNSTTISFSLPQTEKVSAKVFDMTGRIVKTIADGEMQEGVQQIEWNATDEKGNAVDAGIYFLKVDARDFSETKKLSVMK